MPNWSKGMLLRLLRSTRVDPISLSLEDTVILKMDFSFTGKIQFSSRKYVTSVYSAQIYVRE